MDDIIRGIGTPLHWVQLVLASVCIVYGRVAREKAARLLAPLGVIWAVVALTYLGRDTGLPPVVFLTGGTLVMVLALVLLVKAVRDFRAHEVPSSRGREQA